MTLQVQLVMCAFLPQFENWRALGDLGPERWLSNGGYFKHADFGLVKLSRS